MGMPGTTTPPSWTREMVLALPDDGNRYELFDGELLVTPAPRARPLRGGRGGGPRGLPPRRSRARGRPAGPAGRVRGAPGGGPGASRLEGIRHSASRDRDPVSALSPARPDH